MEERSNKTIMCSVLFLDIVEYSKKSVSGQISLKDRFNSYLSAAIRDVPVTDRIILDTGDGAAINFLGDVEDALKAALSLRESLLNEDPDVDHPLLVRMGINLGPVRLVRDINGQPNILGDGINVAQRVMGFADVAQILVSRSYYDAVSRLSPQYAGMFHFQGSRTDKHVREHEVYAIGYPGDKTTLIGKVRPAVVSGNAKSSLAGMMKRAQAAWQAVIIRLGDWSEYLIIRYREAQPRLRVLYIGVIAAPFLLLVALLVIGTRHDKVPASAAVPTEPLADVAVDKGEVAVLKPTIASKPESPKVVQSRKPKTAPRVKPKPSTQEKVARKPAAEPSGGSTEARISVNCTAGTEVFVDGVRKGSVGSKPLVIAMPPGMHTVIVSHVSGGIYSQNVKFNSGVAVQIRPNFCK